MTTKEEDAFERLYDIEIQEDDVLTAAAGGHTGAMIALAPSDYDCHRMMMGGGEDPDQLHLTLAYLGEAAQYSQEQRAAIVQAVQSAFCDGPVETEAFSVNVFNPHTPDMETALVLGIRGEDIVDGRSSIMSALNGMIDMPHNHTPWIPHVTMAYTNDVSRVAELTDRLGPLTFDKLRIAFGDEVMDINLNVDPDVEDLDDYIDVAAAGGVGPSRIPPHLRTYWLGPEGSARVGGWGNKGSYRACVRELSKEGVPRRMVHGECATLYHEATGMWPGRKKEEHSLTAAAVPETGYAQWHGVLAVEGQQSGDGRMFELGSLDWAPPDTLELMYQPSNSGGHKESVHVGKITNVARKNNQILGWGIIDLEAKLPNGENVGREVFRLMNEGMMNGVSVDVDSVDAANVRQTFDPAMPGQPTMTTFDSGRIRGATIVAFPAFVEASIKLTGDIMTASGMPIADNGRTWDKGEAIKRILAWADGDISGKYARAFLYKDPAGDPDLQGTYKFPYADVIDGKLTVIPAAVRNAAARLDSADISAEAKAQIRSKLDGLEKRMGSDAPETASYGPLVAASHTITIPDLPPAWWFDEPTDVEMKGALTVTDEGRVYGLLAPANTLHRARGVPVPTGNVDYSRFMGREVIVEGGGRVTCGVITMNCGHAPTENYGTLENRIEHYDNSCSVVANIKVGERSDGSVFVAGALAYGVSAEQVTRMHSCTLSGDWQRHKDYPQKREFIAALLVPVPGFAMARAEASVQYEDGALVASSVPVEALETADIDSTDHMLLKEALIAKRAAILEHVKLGLVERFKKGAENV